MFAWLSKCFVKFKHLYVAQNDFFQSKFKSILNFLPSCVIEKKNTATREFFLFLDPVQSLPFFLSTMWVFSILGLKFLTKFWFRTTKIPSEEYLLLISNVFEKLSEMVLTIINKKEKKKSCRYIVMTVGQIIRVANLRWNVGRITAARVTRSTTRTTKTKTVRMGQTEMTLKWNIGRRIIRGTGDNPCTYRCPPHSSITGVSI